MAEVYLVRLPPLCDFNSLLPDHYIPKPTNRQLLLKIKNPNFSTRVLDIRNTANSYQNPELPFDGTKLYARDNGRSFASFH